MDLNVVDKVVVMQAIADLLDNGLVEFYLPPARKYVGVTVDNRCVMFVYRGGISWSEYAPKYAMSWKGLKRGQGWWPLSSVSRVKQQLKDAMPRAGR
jgi:hypothetical protein